MPEDTENTETETETQTPIDLTPDQCYAKLEEMVQLLRKIATAIGVN